MDTIERDMHAGDFLDEEAILKDIAFSGSLKMSFIQYFIAALLSVFILAVYLVMNYLLYPGYPIMEPFAEKNNYYIENYPPFRMNERTTYTIAADIISGTLNYQGNPAGNYPYGFPLIAAPFVARFGDIGIFYANAFIAWLCTMVFFVILLRLVSFGLALGFTAVLAFASPNLFFASSAFPELLSQLLFLLALAFLLTGLSGKQEHVYFMLCGIAAGLQAFAEPFMVVSVVIFALVIILERTFRIWKTMGVVFLVFGFGLILIAFFIIHTFWGGEFIPSLSSWFSCTNTHPPTQDLSGKGNFIAGFLAVLFNSPHGVIFTMPYTMVLPFGLICMRRNNQKTFALMVILFLVFVVIRASGSCCPVSLESAGPRHLVPVLPLIVLPLAFVWDEGTGGKVWLTCTLVLAVYISCLGLWTGPTRTGLLATGVLQDREARAILLARKDKLSRPQFRSSAELTKCFFEALQNRDITQWLETLDRPSITAIQGFEREVFATIVRRVHTDIRFQNSIIESIDPDRGTRLNILELSFPRQPEASGDIP